MKFCVIYLNRTVFKRNEYGNNSNKELLTKENHLKLTLNLKDLLANSCDYAQERLVSLLEGKFKVNYI
jgi:hypothetical protein